jgi:hypothetical protein
MVNQYKVGHLIMKALRIKDTLTAEEGYQDKGRTLTRMFFRAVEDMRNVQSLLKRQNPRIGEGNVGDLVNNRYICKLDESVF